MVANAGDSPEFVPERRPGERRKYNRRQSDSQPAPPYFETFDRIAGALEEIESLLREFVGHKRETSGAGWPDETRHADEVHRTGARRSDEDLPT